MRIIAGIYKGRRVSPVPGMSTRPTTSRVREAWASTVQSLLPNGFEDVTVLDAFAGSGALGLEALSRGAAHCAFCDKDRKAQQALQGNLASLEVKTGEVATVITGDVLSPATLRLLSKLDPFDLVILDPPYATASGVLKGFLHTLATSGCLRTGALVSYEQGITASAELDGTVLCAACSPAAFCMVSFKIYGSTRIEYYRYQ
jgi:16S rRNA (guanine966-N2)-methyltransferase